MGRASTPCVYFVSCMDDSVELIGGGLELTHQFGWTQQLTSEYRDERGVNKTNPGRHSSPRRLKGSGGGNTLKQSWSKLQPAANKWVGVGLTQAIQLDIQDICGRRGVNAINPG